MTDQDRQDAIEALEIFRANLDNPHGFPVPAYVTAPAEPVATLGGCYVFQLTPVLNGTSGFVLADAAYPIAGKADLARALSIARDWRWVQRERQWKAERQKRKRGRRKKEAT